MSNVIYAHKLTSKGENVSIIQRKGPEGKDTLVKDLGKKLNFSHTLKLAQLLWVKLMLTGTICTLTTSANGKLVQVAN